MLRHHLLIAFRNLRRHKGSFFINLIGLSTGLACAFLIWLWVQDELGFDKFHVRDKQLYQVMETSKENGNTVVKEATQGPLAEVMARDLPEVQAAVPVLSLQKEGMFSSLRNHDKVLRSAGIFAGSQFFSVFSFPLLEGHSRKVLEDRNSIVLSEALAKSLFGSADAATGKVLEWEMGGMKQSLTVSGVFASLPANNSMKFDFVMTYDLLLNTLVPNFQKWWNEGPSTYLVLKEGTDPQQFNSKIGGFVKGYFKESIFSLFVRPYSSAYLYGHYEDGHQSGGRIAYVQLFSLVAIFILIIACINFMNLSTARASRRLKEVGIKKVVGSSRRALIFQFLSEAVVMAFMALAVACFLVAGLMPLFNNVTGKELHLEQTWNLTGMVLGITLLTGLVSGSYPAFYLSKFKPVAVLKGKIKNSLGELLARKGLVVFQFTISLVLIVAVLVIYRQVDFVQSKNLGYNKNNVLSFDMEGVAMQNTDAFLYELKKQPGILSVSTMQENLVSGAAGGSGASTYGIEWPGKTGKDLIDFNLRAVNYDLIETFGISMAQGRSFSRNYGADSSGIIFNETAIRAMGLKDPIGKIVQMWGEPRTIIGVMKDFHTSSLHESIKPLLFYFNPKAYSTVIVRIENGREQETLRGLEAFYKKRNPGYVFDYRFLDHSYQAQYISEQRVSVLSRYFAGLAILISCLGLFGLAAFNAEVRTKEIGIRKVLGASVGNLALMLSKDFVRLILIAILIAFPLAWWAMSSWLNGFAYHVQLGIWTFVAAAVAILFIAIVTLGWQSARTALMNPTKSLRSE